MMIYSPAQRAMSSKPSRKNSSARSSSSRLPPPQADPKTDPKADPKSNENEPPKPSPKKTTSFQSDSSRGEKASTPAAIESDGPDAFENAENTDDDDVNIEITRASVDLDELPIELVQLIDK